MKFAVVSYVLPPASSGQAVLLYRLLHHLNPEDYCLISLERDRGEQHLQKLPANYYYLPAEFRLSRGYRFGLDKVRGYGNLLLSVTSSIHTRARRIAEIVRREKCEAVLGCAAGHDLIYFPAACLASQLAGVPFYVYFIDDYSNQWVSRLVRTFARRIEPWVMKRAAGVITINEFLRDTLRRRHGIEATVIHNPCDLSVYTSVSDGGLLPHRDEGEIVYTGAVSEGQYDAFMNLLAAMEIAASRKTKLHIYTAQPVDYWSEQGIRGPVVYHEHEDVSNIPRVQSAADFLFLPLGFATPYPDHIRTAVPSKTGEYLASGRPILVHAPADSFLVWYFRRYECGLIVDEPDPMRLAEAIASLLNDEELCRRLVANARERALKDFSIESAQVKFAQVLGLDVPVFKEKSERGQEESCVLADGVVC